MSAEWRETLGVTQPELAKEAGVSKTLIALIEKGQRPLVPPSRDEIWAAMSGFMYRQALNPTGAFKFWATFFGPLDTGQLMGLDKTPAQRVRDYARQMEHDYEESSRNRKPVSGRRGTTIGSYWMHSTPKPLKFLIWSAWNKFEKRASSASRKETKWERNETRIPWTST